MSITKKYLKAERKVGNVLVRPICATVGHKYSRGVCTICGKR